MVLFKITIYIQICSWNQIGRFFSTVPKYWYDKTLFRNDSSESDRFTNAYEWSSVVSLITKAYFHIFGEIFADNILEIAPESPADCSLKNSAGGQNGNMLCPVMVFD